MIKRILLVGAILSLLSQAEGIQDQDFDGVPDNIDECKDTPFLNVVDKTGCTTTILTLPFETEKESLTMTLGYGYSTNDDLINREVQHNTKLKISYYYNSWGYSLQTGYYTHNQDSGSLDTTLRVRKRIKLSSELTLSIGTGLRLPSYDFEGNKMDTLLYTSLHYYPTDALSFFAGYNYIHIGDDEVEYILSETPSGDQDDEDDEEYMGLQNIHKYYFGIGYFFTENLYLNFTYSDENNKFVSEHNIRAISSSLYYKINNKVFTTFYYRREIIDEDLHDNLLFSIGYHIW